MSIRMEVNAAQFYKWCALKYCAAEGRNRRQHGAQFCATSAWQVSPSLSTISFVSTKEIVRTNFAGNAEIFVNPYHAWGERNLEAVARQTRKARICRRECTQTYMTEAKRKPDMV